MLDRALDVFETQRHFIGYFDTENEIHTFFDGKNLSDLDDITFNSYYKVGNLELIKILWNGVKRGKLLNVF